MTELELSEAEYRVIQDRVRLIAQLALDTDPEAIEAMIRAAERADAIGPFLDPTAWSRGHDQLLTVIRHARALATFRREVES